MTETPITIIACNYYSKNGSVAIYRALIRTWTNTMVPATVAHTGSDREMFMSPPRTGHSKELHDGTNNNNTQYSYSFLLALP